VLNDDDSLLRGLLIAACICYLGEKFHKIVISPDNENQLAYKWNIDPPAEREDDPKAKLNKSVLFDFSKKKDVGDDLVKNNITKTADPKRRVEKSTGILADGRRNRRRTNRRRVSFY